MSFESESRTLIMLRGISSTSSRDIALKTIRAYLNVKEKRSSWNLWQQRLASCITDEGITIGRIVNRYCAKRDLVLRAVDFLGA